MKSTVYFTKKITPQKLVEMYDLLGGLDGKIAIKLHSGEEGNQNYLKPDFFKDIIRHVGGTVVECNTAYEGERNNSQKHLATLKRHGWTEFDYDLMDEEGPDLELAVDGLHLKKDIVGKNLSKYDSLLVLSHFKGHPMGGYGGALKQLSIGVASSSGKAYIHSGARTADQNVLWDNLAGQDEFLECMADASKAVVDYFKGKALYINVMKNMSVDCDCCAVAEDPCMQDIGVLASTDPVAIDQACIDLVYKATNDKGQKHFIERVESRHGTHTIDCAEKLGVGSKEYCLVEIE